MIRRAVSALHLFDLDKDYLVRDGKVQIIDAFTGRVMPDRSWEQGLQQLIEIKEGCEVTQQQETVAKISYQKIFSALSAFGRHDRYGQGGDRRILVSVRTSGGADPHPSAVKAQGAAGQDFFRPG